MIYLNSEEWTKPVTTNIVRLMKSFMDQREFAELVQFLGGSGLPETLKTMVIQQRQSQKVIIRFKEIWIQL